VPSFTHWKLMGTLTSGPNDDTEPTGRQRPLLTLAAGW